MKKKQILLAMAIPVMISMNACNTNNENVTASDPATTTAGSSNNVQISTKMKNYSDEYLAFSVPDNWKIDIIKQDNSIFYNIHVFDKNDQFLFTSILDISPAQGAAWLSENKSELEKSFNSSNNPISQSEIFKVKSGQDIFYMEYENNGNYALATFLPCNNPDATLMLRSNDAVNEAGKALIKSGILKNVFKSMEVKFK